MPAIANRRHTLLLMALVIIGFTQPLAQGWLGVILFDGLLMIVMIGILVVIFTKRRDRIFGMILSIVALLSRWMIDAFPGDAGWYFAVIQHALLFVLFQHAVAVILRGIFREREILVDQIVGSVCGFLLVGAAWTNLYLLIDLFDSGQFRASPHVFAELHEEHLRSTIFMQYSLCIMTGATFTDIVAASHLTNSLAWMEAMISQFYLAIIVAQIVTLKTSLPTDPKP